MKVNDKKIAIWLGINLSTFYRWRRSGLIVMRPTTEQEAIALAKEIRQAQDRVGDQRNRQRGRPALIEFASVLSGRHDATGGRK
jgi:hypothetical protein